MKDILPRLVTEAQHNLLLEEEAIEGAVRDAADQPMKIKNTLTTAQIACFFRFMVDTGFIITRNHAELMRTIAAIFSSERVDDISPQSLRSKYFAVEKYTADELKDMFLLLVQAARKL